jgi:hypothetical protein
MDPYLEDPALWLGIHTWLLVEIANVLGPLLRPQYYVSVEQRFYIASSDSHESPEADPYAVADVLVSRQGRRNPDHDGRNGVSGGAARTSAAQRHSAALTVELPAASRVRQRYLEVRRAAAHDVVTVIELLSPTNKRPGDGRTEYETKRNAVLDSEAHFVEIDLLRAGEPLPLSYRGERLTRDRAGHYRVLVSRAEARPFADLLIASLRDPLPAMPIPLQPGEDEPEVDIKSVINTVYDRGSYDLRIDYRTDPVPPLSPEDAAWADRLLREKGLR